MFGKSKPIEIKSVDELALMRQAGLVVAKTLERIRSEIAVGMTTADLDALARESIADHGATSSFLGYHGFPAVICASVNDEVVHGIPGERVIKSADIVSIDCGAIIEDWHGDAAISIVMPDAAEDISALSEVTQSSLWAGLAQARVGRHLSDIGGRLPPNPYRPALPVGWRGRRCVRLNPHRVPGKPRDSRVLQVGYILVPGASNEGQCSTMQPSVVRLPRRGGHD